MHFIIVSVIDMGHVFLFFVHNFESRTFPYRIDIPTFRQSQGIKSCKSNRIPIFFNPVVDTIFPFVNYSTTEKKILEQYNYERLSYNLIVFHVSFQSIFL